MIEHVCGPPYPLKAAGRCLCCGEDVYEVRHVRDDPEHPLDGQPVRLGPQRESGTQVAFLLSNGSEVAISFCCACADAIRPEHYRALWRACVLRADVSLALAGRRVTERRVVWARSLATYPIAQLRRRHEVDGLLALDRRHVHA